MIVVIALLVLLAGIKFAGKGTFYGDSFNVAQTRALKGLFAIYVIFHHLCTYIADYFPSFYAFKYLGFLMVGGFFLISGYGLMHGVMNRQNYLHSFFRNRIVAILIPYYIINIFYIYANYVSKALTTKYVILSLFGFNLWYVMAITILYIGFYLCFRFMDKKYGVWCISIFVYLYIQVMYILFAYMDKPAFGYWWYNSVISFAIGIWYCYAKEKIDRFLKKHYKPALGVLVAVIIPTYLFTCLHFNDYVPFLLTAEILCATAFAITVIMLSMKVKIGNPILNLCGDLSFELYLSHAIFIFALRSDITLLGITLNVNNNFLYLALIILCSMIFSYIVHYISGKILKLIKK